MNFGQLLKTIRLNNRITLRQCSAQLGLDASNWSKMERGVNPAPKDSATLERWASFFGLTGDSRQAFFDEASLSRHELPSDLVSDEKVLQALPIFFRALRGSELDLDRMRQFVEDVRAANTRDAGVGE